MLLANYASDSESETDDSGPGPSKPIQPVAAAKPATAPHPPAPAAIPTARGKKRGPVRITLDLPKVTGEDSEEGKELSKPSRGVDSGDEEDRGSKKPKFGGAGLKGGKGSSMLLGMLPPPKRKLPTSTSKSSSLAVNKSMATRPAAPAPAPKPVLPSVDREVDDEIEDEDEEPGLGNGSGTGMFMPASVARGKVKAAKQDDGLDLFGLASAPAPTPSASSSKPSLPRPTEITSAPTVADFVPPPPTAGDPYPGYYQLPKGGWAAYDPEYYHSFFPTQSDAGAGAGEDEEDGRLGKHWDELKGREGEVMEFDPTQGIREAREEEERRSKVIKPRMLGDDHEYKEIGQVKGLASERHQLTSLLSTAYTQRDALEERLQANKKSMRVARTKYGF